ncbi:MAG: hypothetical protein FWB78_08870, partial [Treponema sp.]|nr:hypothetical protein [Treponema sp.]
MVSGIIVRSTPRSLIVSVFHDNHAPRQGGAIWTSGPLYVSGSTFVGNREERQGGGAIFASN